MDKISDWNDAQRISEAAAAGPSITQPIDTVAGTRVPLCKCKQMMMFLGLSGGEGGCIRSDLHASVVD